MPARRLALSGVVFSPPSKTNSAQQLCITGNICWMGGPALGYSRALANRITQRLKCKACAKHCVVFSPPASSTRSKGGGETQISQEQREEEAKSKTEKKTRKVPRVSSEITLVLILDSEGRSQTRRNTCCSSKVKSQTWEGSARLIFFLESAS